MLWPARWPPTLGSGPACCSAAPRVPPGGITTASLSWASCRNCRPFSGICSTSRLAITSLISALVVCSNGASAVTVTSSESVPSSSSNGRSRVRPISSTTPVRTTRRNPGQLGRYLPGADRQRRHEEAAVGVGDPLDRETGVDVRRHDGRARQHGSRQVAHHAAEIAGIRLAARRRRIERQEADEQHQSTRRRRSHASAGRSRLPRASRSPPDRARTGTLAGPDNDLL